MIDLSSIHSLELIQNLQVSRSKDCLFGLLNHTLTPMGSRLLRGNVLQPPTDVEVIRKRSDALEELLTREEMFHAVRQGKARNDAMISGRHVLNIDSPQVISRYRTHSNTRLEPYVLLYLGHCLHH